MRRRLERLLQRPAPLLPLLGVLRLLELGTCWRLPCLFPRWQRLLFLLQLLPRLLLMLLLLFLPLLLDGAKPSGPRRLSHDVRSLGLLVRWADVPRRPTAARPITYGDRIHLDPRTRGLGGSLLPLKVRCLDPLWRRGGGLTCQGTGQGALSICRRPRVRRAYKTQNKGQSLWQST